MKQDIRKHCPDDLDDEGCLQLAAAVIRQAIDDHLRARKHLPAPAAERLLEETAGFFRSARFRRLTGGHGDAVLRMIRKEVGPDDPA